MSCQTLITRSFISGGQELKRFVYASNMVQRFRGFSLAFTI
jgi:hypothetical protein